jgi:TetR/AcrR family transcriptional repressor of nem operon
MARPREFDEHTVLDAAIDVFWTKGYEASSTRDLAARTGLTASSLYAAFGDKRGLFRRALDRYLCRLREKMARLERTVSPALAITAFFEDTIARSLADKQRRGCMLVNSVLEASPQDAELRGAIANELTLIQDFFERCFVAGQKRLEIPFRHSAEDAARHLLAVLLGIRVLARARAERQLLTGAVRQALHSLDLPPLTTGAGTPARLAGRGS